MTGATFVRCPECQRLMLGQRVQDLIYPQPHDCPKDHLAAQPPKENR